MSSADATIGSMMKQLFPDVSPAVTLRMHRNHHQQGVNQHIPHHPNMQQNGKSRK